MKEFHLQIVTPDGIFFDGMAESLLVRSEMGDIEIMAGHADLFSSLGIGRARIKTNGESRIKSRFLRFVLLYFSSFSTPENVRNTLKNRKCYNNDKK